LAVYGITEYFRARQMYDSPATYYINIMYTTVGVSMV